MSVTSSVIDNSILARLWPRSSGNALVRGVVLVLVGTALLALSARIQVPFWPVKMSMQSFTVLVLAVAYGGRLACATVLAYLAEGALGLPVFVDGGGLGYFAGPTTGYLAGFVVAAILIGACAERGAMRSMPRALAVLFVGHTIILALGAAWLATLIGAEKAAYAGFVVFLPAEALKIALAAALVPLLRPAFPETPRNA
jgi:biotin transport system substrate-specific component